MRVILCGRKGCATLELPDAEEKACEDCGARHTNRYKCDDCLIDQAITDGVIDGPSTRGVALFPGRGKP